jgi:hypothetical protein
MTNEDAGGTVETPTIDELTTQLTAEKEARAKAEAKIVDMKKASKETTPKTKETTVKEVPEVDTSKFMTKEDFEKEKFFESNPELVEHKDTINEYVSK